jgi:hypothetical protein
MKKLKILTVFVSLFFLPVCICANFQSAVELNAGIIDVSPAPLVDVIAPFFELRGNVSLFNSENWFYRMTMHIFNYSYLDDGSGYNYTETDTVSYFGLVGINYSKDFDGLYSIHVGGDCGLSNVLRNGSGNTYNNTGSLTGTLSPSNSGSNVFGAKLDSGLHYNINQNFYINLTVGGILAADIHGTGIFVVIGAGWMNPSQSNDLKKNEDADKSIVDSDAHTGSSDLPALPESNTNSKVNYLVTDGDTKFSAKDYKAALELYNKAVLQEETYELYKKIGSCYFYLGEKESSKSAYKKALKLNPDDSKLKEWLINYK